MSTVSISPEDALGVLRRHARHTSAALALNHETEHFATSGIDGIIAYRTAGRHHAVQFGSVYAALEDQPRLLREYHAWAAEHKRRLCAVQLVAEDLPHYLDLGYRIGQFGASFSIALDSFKTTGRKFEKVRNKIARARRLGITVSEVGDDLVYDEKLAADLDALDARWLTGKGRHVKRIEFMVGERGRPGDKLRRLFVARQEGRPIAYVTYSPAFGPEPGVLYDLTRREPDSPPGVIELIFVEAVQRLREEGLTWLHLGFTPFCELSEHHRPATGSPRVLDWLTNWIADHGAFIYPAATQAEFKRKWQPSRIEPEYIAFHRSISLPAVWRLLRLTQSI